LDTPAYDELTRTWTRLHHLGHLQSMAGWDRSAMMPPKGSEARAGAMAEMDALMHHIRTDAQLAQWLQRAEDEDLGEIERANLREMRREWRAANALPQALVQAQSLASARCEHAWRSQRPANDWAGFLVNFRDVLALAREEAQRLADDSGLSVYDALMDRFEPGTTSAMVDALFGELRQWLPQLIQRTIERQSQWSAVEPVGPFPPAAQRVLCERVMALLGFDFEAGRLDVSAHPFCGGVPEDVRITTRFGTDDFLRSLMGTIHETGHARYEQGRPRQWLTQPVSLARSTAIHESQSLAFEMQVARSRPLAGLLAPLIAQAFGDQPAFEAENLYRLLTRIERSLIRVDADEATYPAHIILRYEIERALIEGEVEPEDIPALWDAKMMELLGVDTRGNFKDGPLQDVHWPVGAFGYFPGYTLGAMYAAQWFAAMRSSIPELDAHLARGELAPVFDWLRDHIWAHGSRWSTSELALRASGEALNPAHFRHHLEARYLA
jgi:carboxypeptidase Taq